MRTKFWLENPKGGRILQSPRRVLEDRLLLKRVLGR
jgi:hypothetical protein